MNAPPPGYNANESMLEGGTAPITSVMGGGAKPVQKKNNIKRALKLMRKKFSRRQKLRQTKGTRKHSQRGGVGSYALPSHDAPIAENQIDTLKTYEIPEPDNPVLNAPTSVEPDFSKYSELMNELWKRSGGSSAVKSLMKSVMIPSNPSKVLGQTGSDRLCVILPSSTKEIKVFPAINGDIEKFKKYISLAFNADNTANKDENISYIFTCPFFDSSNTTTNATLFRYFVQIKNLLDDTTSRLYILTQYSTEHIIASRMVTQKLTADINDKTPIYPLLEPTYIMYPYAINIIALDNNDAPYPGIDPDKRRGILFSAAGVGEPVLPASDSSMEGPINVILKSLDPVVGIAYKPDITKEDPKLSSLDFRLINVKDDIRPSVYYRYTKVPSTNRAISKLDNFSSIFLENEDAYTEDVPLVSIELGTQVFALRTPLPRVKEDWMNTIFTDQEAFFLNTLNINPTRMSNLFKEGWKKTLTRNLTTICRSKCFTDNKVILHAECQETREFTAKIFEDFVKNAEDIVDLEKNQMQATVANLTAQVLQQKNTPTASIPPGGLNIFDINDFTDTFYGRPPQKVLSVWDFNATGSGKTFTATFKGTLTEKDKALLGNPTVTSTAANTYTLTFTQDKTVPELNNLANTNTAHISLVKNPEAEIKMNPEPGFIPNQFSIDTLVVDLVKKQHYKATLRMNMIQPISTTSPTELEIINQSKILMDATKNITDQYRRIKLETEKPASSAKFPQYQIILPE